MRRLHSLWVASALATALAMLSCFQITSTVLALEREQDAHYTQGPASRGGIGRFYMGREIARVMGHWGATWLERPEREAEERSDLVVANISLSADDVVADIGAGSGFFSFRLSRLVPSGKVLAVDIQPEMLDLISQRAQTTSTTNVIPVLGSIRDPNLPDGSVDVVLMVDAYHEFSHPREMMEALVTDLRKGGIVVLVEYRGEDLSLSIAPLHKMTEAQVRREMEAVGLRWQETKSFLPKQHFMIFTKPN